MIIQVSAECFPAAKAGGLADVVGALPKYLKEIGVDSWVIIPKYHTKWLNEQSWETITQGTVWISYPARYTVYRLVEGVLDFPLYAIDIPGKFDRDGIYKNRFGEIFMDGPERFSCFQIAALQYISQLADKPELIHCHDNHTGLIPFLMQYGNDFRHLSNIPTVFTIHNGQYHGAFGWEKFYLIPPFADGAGGILEWQGRVNPLAAGIKCAWKVTTVSPSYMRELSNASGGLEVLLQSEQHKCLGILNGIDTEVWDPKTDPMISYNLKSSIDKFKKENKKELCQRFGFDHKKPLISFIGRFVFEKAADVLPDVVYQTLIRDFNVNLLMLGSGDANVQQAFHNLKGMFPNRFNDYIGYNEALAHQIYAGSDFLLMPSRVEPCGLNQMYSMRYATVPMARRTGGLIDSVRDIGDGDGTGIMFNHPSTSDMLHSIWRAMELYADKDAMKAIRNRIVEEDFSWNKSALTYNTIYQELINS